MQQALAEKFPQANLKAHGSPRHVGATVGADVRSSAIIASLLAMFGILVYVAFRYEFSFAVGAVVAVLHDVLLTIGAIASPTPFPGRQFNATVVAAVLTIIGFSINDKIVIFDRIREDLKLGVRGTFKEIINQALNQTLSRTIITCGTVFIATLSLYRLGRRRHQRFCLHVPHRHHHRHLFVHLHRQRIVLWWHKGERPNIGASAVSDSDAATAKV